MIQNSVAIIVIPGLEPGISRKNAVFPGTVDPRIESGDDGFQEKARS